LRMYQLGFETFRFGFASAIAVIIFLIILFVTILQFRVLGRE
jgi:ABC-type sugar transport system permease subunit